MAEDDNKPQRTYLESLIARQDTQMESPSERASKVYTYLKLDDGLTNYDLVCFSIEFLGLMVASGEMPWIEQEAKRLATLLHHQHYILKQGNKHATKLAPKFGSDDVGIYRSTADDLTGFELTEPE